VLRIDRLKAYTEDYPIDNWQPSAKPFMLQARADLLAFLRAYFAEQSVMEVDPPLLATTSVTDINIESIGAQAMGQSCFLQTSPEFFMKRLLASGAGDIYSLGKVFREAEQGSRHNPEFTLLEWYRLNWDEFQLITEVENLVVGAYQAIQNSQISVSRTSYGDCFEQTLGIDPHGEKLSVLQSLAEEKGYPQWRSETRANCLDLLFSELVEPQLSKGIVTVYDYPACQAALAQIHQDAKGRPVSRRFECFLNGMELANGYFELTDAEQQLQRFHQDIEQRQLTNKPAMSIDAKLDLAMQQGLPSCSGVALGVDRLLMQLSDAQSITKVMAFPWNRC
jgi:lysyl-tRNA synthetase class 2